MFLPGAAEKEVFLLRKENRNLVRQNERLLYLLDGVAQRKIFVPEVRSILAQCPRGGLS